MRKEDKDRIAAMVKDSIEQAGILDVAACDLIEDEDHPVFGVELKDGTEFFLEITE